MSNYAIESLQKLNIHSMPAIKFSKKGKWHLYDQYFTGKPACNLVKNKSPKLVVEKNENLSLTDPNICTVCSDSIFDRFIRKEMEKDMVPN